MQYKIHNNYKIVSLQSPYYQNRQQITYVQLIHDAKEDKKEALKIEFEHACTLFGKNLTHLAQLDKVLSKNEKTLLVVSFNNLLELHTLLNKK